uniref:RRM domain-containing protein n=1 Tax=Ditylum brightwellii TaxID=49249 RepID=A0A7S2E5R7_9STRA|mmetsp:Transcript_14186/g.21293  ORF Transcript_14186/g.21293 Transcript_14186/m.21293 type:complete len:361 (+) Transcript_14186:188-1270(+)
MSDSSSDSSSDDENVTNIPKKKEVEKRKKKKTKKIKKEIVKEEENAVKEEEETKKEKKLTKREKRRAKEKARKIEERKRKLAEKGEEEEDSSNEQEEDPRSRVDFKKGDIFAGRDVTSMPAKKKRKMSEDEKIAMRKKDLRRTIYVEGIPFEMDEEKVKEFFHKGLDVEDDIIDVRLPRWQDSGRLKGYGHIVFNTIHIREKALRTLNGKSLGTRYITIKEANAPKNDVSSSFTEKGLKVHNKPREQPANCHTIFIKNLPYGATEDDISEAFAKFGKIVEDGGVRLARNYKTRESKGFGYVHYKNMEAAKSAVTKSFELPIFINNRCVFVDYDDTGRAKGSFRDEKGWFWKKKFGEEKKN